MPLVIIIGIFSNDWFTPGCSTGCIGKTDCHVIGHGTDCQDEDSVQIFNKLFLIS